MLILQQEFVKNKLHQDYLTPIIVEVVARHTKLDRIRIYAEWCCYLQERILAKYAYNNRLCQKYVTVFFFKW
jgi:hypothetical protein